MINTSFTTGIFPNDLKVANVIPVHNQNDRFDLSYIGKIYEKMMRIRLTSFLDKNKVFSSFQFGFQNNHSANHALTSLTGMIRSALDNDQFACGVFIDLQRAFDTADNQILSKMNIYGIRGIP